MNTLQLLTILLFYLLQDSATTRIIALNTLHLCIVEYNSYITISYVYFSRFERN